MSRWGNSRELTAASYELVRENPSMYRWTVRAALHAALVGGLGGLLGIVVVALGAALVDGGGTSEVLVGWIALVAGIALMGAAAVAGRTAANRQFAGLVAATDEVLHGREPESGAGSARAMPPTGALVRWSAISAAVGALVSLIRGDGDSGIVVGMLRALLAGLVASVWAVVTTLVLPVMVFEGTDAVPAIKRSAGIVRSTWGEAVFGSVRIGARFALVFTLPGFLLIAGGIVVALAVGGAMVVAGVLLALVGLVLVVIGAVRAATCRNVFGVALYRWATGEGALGPFSEADLRGAVEVRPGAQAAV